ncbi:MAG: PfkB family carbohydrate kinase [Butyricicoccaceae bacterium]
MSWTGSNTENGVAQAIERYILRKSYEKAVAIGELLIDFVPQQRGCASSDEVQQFERVAGGAPANVATAVARLGSEAKMISQVGE